MEMKKVMFGLMALAMLTSMVSATYYQVEGSGRNVNGPSEGYGIGGGYFGIIPPVSDWEVVETFPAAYFGAGYAPVSCPKENGVPVCV